MQLLYKSQIEKYLELFEAILSPDYTSQDSYFRSQSRKDFLTLCQRTLSREGVSFLTKTLPKLGKALDKGLNELRFNCPREFGRAHKNRSIPAFMQAYFNLIFDEDGVLRPNPDVSAIKHIRQVTYLVYKIELPYDDKLLRTTFEKFVSTDQELSSVNLSVNPVVQVAGDLIESLYSGFDPKAIKPRHGPGAVAAGEKLDQKWEFKIHFDHVHQMYPYYEYFVVGGAAELGDRLHWYKNLERRKSSKTRTIAVPKDSRGPRLISIEPLELMWIQQGLGRAVMDHLETNHLSKGHINFSSQEVNRKLALDSSLSREYATLDLKDASDRVSMDLVRRLFGRHPQLLRALMATRSSATSIPTWKTGVKREHLGGRIFLHDFGLGHKPFRGSECLTNALSLDLTSQFCDKTDEKAGEVVFNKFAPMGSALCFPIEASCFWAIAVGALQLHTRLSKPSKSVYVYGDDIIVPTEYADVVMQALESVGLKVNRDKSCIQGFFRESCGCDAYQGVDITPVKLRKLWSGRRSDGTVYASYIAYCNSLGRAGYTRAAGVIENWLRRTYGRIPYGTAFASYPCLTVDSVEEAEIANKLDGFRYRVNQKLHRLEYQLVRVVPEKVNTTLDGWKRLLRNVLTSFEDLDPSVNVVPRSTRLKRGWVSC